MNSLKPLIPVLKIKQFVIIQVYNNLFQVMDKKTNKILMEKPIKNIKHFKSLVKRHC